jgi:hypothetical protein
VIDADEIRRRTEESCADQNEPTLISDPVILARLAAVVRPAIERPAPRRMSA